MKLRLRNCPFCGEPPEIEPWHGGTPTKVMISCPMDRYCNVNPQVTGETPQEAAKHWNNRDYRGDGYRIQEYDETREENMQITKITTSTGEYFTNKRIDFARLLSELPEGRIQNVEMTEEVYQSIPATQDAQQFFTEFGDE